MSRREEPGESLTSINRIASWVKMKANSFSHNFFSRPISNGTDSEHGPEDHAEEDERQVGFFFGMRQGRSSMFEWSNTSDGDSSCLQ